MAEPKKKKSTTAKTRVTTNSAASGSNTKPKASVRTSVKAVESNDSPKVGKGSTKTKDTPKKEVSKTTNKTTAKAAVVPAPEKQAKSKKNKKAKKEKKQKDSYLKGAWYELRQVRWPNRSNTWQMTIAVIIFSLILAGVVLLLDLLFQYLFNRIILQG